MGLWSHCAIIAENVRENLVPDLKKLGAEIKESWGELKEDLKDIFRVKFMRPGAIYIKNYHGNKICGIYITNKKIIYPDRNGKLIVSSPKEFAELAKNRSKIYVAAHNSIAYGNSEIALRAREALTMQKTFSSMEDAGISGSYKFACWCLGDDSNCFRVFDNVQSRIKVRFNEFDWGTWNFENI